MPRVNQINNSHRARLDQRLYRFILFRWIRGKERCHVEIFFQRAGIFASSGAGAVESTDGCRLLSSDCQMMRVRYSFIVLNEHLVRMCTRHHCILTHSHISPLSPPLSHRTLQHMMLYRLLRPSLICEIPSHVSPVPLNSVYSCFHKNIYYYAYGVRVFDAIETVSIYNTHGN